MNVCIFTKDQDDFYQDVVRFLKACRVKIVEDRKKANGTIILGGDGTVLAAARQGIKNPAIVINTGHLGFLTSCTKEHFQASLGDFLSKRYTTTSRSMLTIRVGDGEFLALNDLVITKNGLSKLTKVSLFVIDGKKEMFVADYRADGLIVATPTGSTAYSLSANGPIMHPDCANLIVTPICPQGLTQRPLVLPSHMKVVIKPLDSDLYVSVDGQVGQPLGDDFVQAHINHQIEIVDPPDTYFQVLRQKLGWGIKPV